MAGSLRLVAVPAEEADPMMRHTFSALMLIAALGSTAFVSTAQAATRDRREPVTRGYDRGHRDDRNWNASGDRSYRGGGGLSNRYSPYRTFSPSGRSHRQEYSRWRHDDRR
jgi:hypothetical protein